MTTNVRVDIFPDLPPSVGINRGGDSYISFGRACILLRHKTPGEQAAWLRVTAARLTDLADQVDAHHAEQAS